MLNHFRTLLANVPPLNGAGFYLAEELIDPAFAPVRPSAAALAARRVLFGAAPDRDMVNYRTRQLLAVVHATPLADYVTALDGRLTYAVGADDGLLGGAAFAPAATQLGGAAADLVFFGAPLAPDAAGRVRLVYGLRTAAPGVATVTTPGRSRDFPFTVSDGLSTPVPLPDSGYAARLPAEDAGYEWLVEVRNRPQRDLSRLAADLGALGEPVLAALFGGGAAEPYRTCRNLWSAQRELPLRLAAFVTALVYRAEEARRAAA